MSLVPKSRARSNGIQRIDLAYAELASSETARDTNRDVVLELIRTKQPISRADLTRLSGLQSSTISLITDQLIAEKWVTEGATAITARGRRPTLLTLNSDLVIAVADVRPNQIIVAVVDLNGHILDREALPLIKDPKRGVDRVIHLIQRMMRQHPDKSFEGIGLSLPGRVDPVSQRLVLAPNIPWADYDIKHAIETEIPLQVEMDNDANTCLLSELWFGRMEGVRNAVLIAISEGLGCAILANGQLLTGKLGLAGEFGHISLDREGPLCGCGRKGCWEVYASTQSALAHYAELVPDSGTIGIIELLNLAEEGNSAALASLNRQAYYLGLGLRMVTAALSPEVIHLNGGLTSSWHLFGPIVEAETAASMLAGTPPRIAITTDVEMARLRGAAILVLQRHSGYSRSNRSSAESRPARRSRTGAENLEGKRKPAK